VFARHLPPSAEWPRVLALDPQAGAELAGLAEITTARGPGDWPAGPFDAIAGPAAPDQLAALRQRLRPGGRLILTDPSAPETLLAALAAAGLIHCLVEPQASLSLYRGERPPEGSPLERHQPLAAANPANTTSNYELPVPNDILPITKYELPIPNYELPITNYASLTNYELPITNYASVTTRYLFLLITQTPNKPAWKLAPDERVTWRAATVVPRPGAPPVLLAFSSLVKAVAYMQAAVLAQRLAGVNKVGKFPAAAMPAWPLLLALNSSFEQTRELEAGPPFEVEAQTAITVEE